MQIILRINGALPDINLLGGEDNSERAAEVKNQNKLLKYFMFYFFEK